MFPGVGHNKTEERFVARQRVLSVHNNTARGGPQLDCRTHFRIVHANYPEGVATNPPPPPWIHYVGRWCAVHLSSSDPACCDA
jgi:hypothetical protein